MGSSAQNDLSPVLATNLHFGGAFGSGPDFGRVIAVDGYGRAYWVDLQDRTRAAAPTLDLLDWLASTRRPWSFSSQVTPSLTFGFDLVGGARIWSQNGQYDEQEIANRFALTAASNGQSFSVLHDWEFETQFGLAAEGKEGMNGLLGAPAFGSPYLALLRGADGIVFAQEMQDTVSVRFGVASDRLAQSGGHSSAEAWIGEVIGRLPNGSWIGLQLGTALEGDRLLGSEGGGALELPPASTTLFTGLAGTLRLNDGLELFGTATFGFTDPDRGADSLLKEVSALRSSSFAVGMARRELLVPDDRFTVAVSQPLRVEAGTAVFDRPVGWTSDGRILRRRERISLEPNGREIDIELGYLLPLGTHGSVGINWLSQFEPGHDRDASPEHTLAVRLRAEF